MAWSEAFYRKERVVQLRDCIAQWQEWYTHNATRFNYQSDILDDHSEPEGCQIALSGINTRLQFRLYGYDRGGDIFILDHHGEIWDFLLWLDYAGGKPQHDWINDTFEPFLAWSNALKQVDRIQLIATDDMGFRYAEFYSPPDESGNRTPLFYDVRAGAFCLSVRGPNRQNYEDFTHPGHCVTGRVWDNPP